MILIRTQKTVSCHPTTIVRDHVTHFKMHTRGYTAGIDVYLTSGKKITLNTGLVPNAPLREKFNITEDGSPQHKLFVKTMKSWREVREKAAKDIYRDFQKAMLFYDPNNHFASTR